MRIYSNGTLPCKKASEINFVGDVYIRNYLEHEFPSRLMHATVSFTPGSRTPWKVNPLGQTLIVIDGVGWMQCESEPIVEIRAGDIVMCSAGRRHWDGATPYHSMTYIAIQELRVEFGERVDEEVYLTGPVSRD